MNQELMALLNEVAVLFPVFLLIFTFRGYLKALAAWSMGDTTAYMTGFLTLNPLAHVDIRGVLVFLAAAVFFYAVVPFAFSREMLLIFTLAVGLQWTFPVPVNEQNFRNRTTGLVLTMLAGPVGNILLALIFLYLQKYSPLGLLPFNMALSFAQIIARTIDVSLFFAVIDFLPLPPFDGGHLLMLLLPWKMQYVMRWFEEYAYFIVLALFIIPGINTVFFHFLFFLKQIVHTFLMYLVI